jgi:hypothetical protein
MLAGATSTDTPGPGVGPTVGPGSEGWYGVGPTVGPVGAGPAVGLGGGVTGAGAVGLGLGFTGGLPTVGPGFAPAVGLVLTPGAD